MVGAAEVVIGPSLVQIGEHVIKAGERLSIDGSTGEVFLGGAELSIEPPPADLAVLLAWADRYRAGKVAVRANADNEADARQGAG